MCSVKKEITSVGATFFNKDADLQPVTLLTKGSFSIMMQISSLQLYQ